MKITYKLYEFRNGLGETVFMAKEKKMLFWVIPVWMWISINSTWYDWHMWWPSRESAMESLTDRANKLREKLEKQKRWKLGEQLTLVVIEKVEV